MQSVSFVNHSVMRVVIIKIALAAGLLAITLHYYNPALFCRVVNFDFRAAGANFLSKLHLEGFLKGIDGQSIQVVAALLRNEQRHDNLQKIVGLHRAIQIFTKTPLCREAGLDWTTGDLDVLDREVTTSLHSLAACQLHGEAQNRARMLEQILLTRLHEMIFWRKSCEMSLRHATQDPLHENALIPVAEAVQTSASGTNRAMQDGHTASGAFTSQMILSGIMMHAADGGGVDDRVQILEKMKEKAKAEDTARRRQLFAQGAKQRWNENSARLRVLIEEDLRRLDVLMASAVL